MAHSNVDPSSPASRRKLLLLLLLLSSSALFFELALIRWVPGSVRVLGYFTNLILIASFLGLGAGALLSRFRTSLFEWWPLTLLLLVVSTLVFGSVATLNPAGEHVWFGDAPFIPEEAVGFLATLNVQLWHNLSAALQGTSFAIVVALFFLLTAVHFVCIGQRIGHLFAELPPLRAYGYDLGGSIVGILLFSVVSALAAPPIAWFLMACAGLALATRWSSWRALLKALAIALSLALVLAAGARYHWSPYYKIEVTGIDRVVDVPGAEADQYPYGSRVRVNNDYHQMALDLSPKAPDNPFVKQWRALYDAPYAGHEAGRVLIVGAGTGNDVQAALRNGATHVTAVEIDPRIVQLGQRLHPEKPYDDERVRVVINDARSFLKGSDEEFDTVVFGFLDSHTLFSSFSTLRIDNYVYTVESFVETVHRLRPGGRLAVTFTTATSWLKHRLYTLVALALGEAPQTTKVAFTNGRIFWGHRPAEWTPPSRERIDSITSEMVLPTDDWPFLYLEKPLIPAHYLYFVAIIILLGIGSFFLVERPQRRLNIQFFFLGAGFMLLETRSITEIALLFGSTWAVNAIAFCAILVAVLGANFLVIKVRRLPPLWALYAAVAALLVLGYSLPPGALYVPSVALRLLLAVVVLFSPIFVAGIIFSSQFRTGRHPNLLFGSNLLGAMLGGALEYISLFVGLQPLYLLGVALYLAAFAAVRRTA